MMFNAFKTGKRKVERGTAGLIRDNPERTILLEDIEMEILQQRTFYTCYISSKCLYFYSFVRN